MYVARTGWARRATLVLAIGIASFGVVACGNDDETDAGDSSSGELTKVEFLLPYQDSMSFLGLEVAKGNGCFEDEGIDLKTMPSNGSDYVVQQLIAGNVKFGQTGADNILIANSLGRDVRGIAQVGGRGIFSIVAPAGGTAAIEDVEKLGVTDLGGGEIPLVKAVIADAGLTEGGDVELVVVGEGGPAALEALNSGDVDAFAGANNDIAGMIAAGLDPVTITPEKFLTVPTTEVAAMQETLDNPEDAEIAAKIAKCYRQGAEFAIDNPEEALDLSCEQVPEECSDMKVANIFLEQVLDAYAVPEGAEHYTEHLPVESYDLVQTSLAAEDISQPQDIAEVFPDEYMEEINAD